MEASLRVNSTKQITLTMSEAEAKQLSALLEICSQIDAEAMLSTEYKEPPFEKFDNLVFNLKMAFLRAQL